MSTKNLDDMTPRLQRLRLKLLPYCYNVEYIPGKDHHIPDWLSQSIPDGEFSNEEENIISEVKNFGEDLVNHIAIKDRSCEK
ncbi:hypothetical protein B566_EDAN013765 [Ephemera danica]|nr:hypothetical protein B566_EDAN013765 [Ephemera danica]